MLDNEAGGKFINVEDGMPFYGFFLLEVAIVIVAGQWLVYEQSGAKQLTSLEL